MDKRRITEALAAHADELTGRSDATKQNSLTEQGREELDPLFRLSERLQQGMQPVQPSSAFVRSLKEELVEEARQKMTSRKHLKRGMVIGAAAVGSVVSLASVVGAVVVLAKWLRTRAQARHVPAG